MTPSEILEAICRGWLPEQIMEVASKYQLKDDPPLGAVRFKVIREPAQREGTEPRARSRAA